MISWAFIEKMLLSVGRLPVVSDFGDGDCGTDEIHTYAREISRRRDARGALRLLEISRARVYFARHTIAIVKIRDYSQSIKV